MKKKYELKVKRLHDKNKNDYKKMTPEERLNLLELLRLESGKFLYEYPTRFQRVIKVIRKK